MPNSIQIAGVTEQSFRQQVQQAFGTLPTKWLTTSASYVIPSLAAGAVASVTNFALNGVVPNSGHMVLPPQFSTDTQGRGAYGWVSGTNVVSFFWSNPTATNLGSLSGTVFLAAMLP